MSNNILLSSDSSDEDEADVNDILLTKIKI